MHPKVFFVEKEHYLPYKKMTDMVHYSERSRKDIVSDLGIPQISSSSAEKTSETLAHIDMHHSFSGQSTGRSLLKFSGTWVGDDGERCLRDVFRTRTRAIYE
jgi:hypothetical protein